MWSDLDFSSAREYEQYIRCLQSIQLGDQIEVELYDSYSGSYSWRLGAYPSLRDRKTLRIFCPVIGLIKPHFQVAAITQEAYDTHNGIGGSIFDGEYHVALTFSRTPDFAQHAYTFTTTHHLPRIHRVLKGNHANLLPFKESNVKPE